MKRAPDSRLNDFEQLIDLGKEKGHLTYAEINKFLPDDVSSSDMESLLDELEELDIEVFDDKDMAAHAAKGEEADEAEEEEALAKAESSEREMDEPEQDNQADAE